MNFFKRVYNWISRKVELSDVNTGYEEFVGEVNGNPAIVRVDWGRATYRRPDKTNNGVAIVLVWRSDDGESWNLIYDSGPIDPDNLNNMIESVKKIYRAGDIVESRVISHGTL